MDFLNPDERFKFIDDSSFLEILNLISAGLTCYYARQQIPSDISVGEQFLPPENVQTNKYIQKINQWTQNQQMKMNFEKTKYMIINFCHSRQFQTRVYIDQTLLEQVKEAKLLGIIISEDLSWHANTNNLVKKAYMRMIILKNYLNLMFQKHS